MNDKTTVRATSRASREALTVSEVADKSQRITDQVLALSSWSAAELIALYAPIGAEVRTQALFRAARKAGKIVCFPRVKPDGGELIFHRIDDWEALAPGCRGILEPTRAAEVVDHAAVDTYVVPGVAFDTCRNRLGYGGGFYDRALSRSRTDAAKIGLAFEVQIVPDVPVESCDVPMDTVVTEDRRI